MNGLRLERVTRQEESVARSSIAGYAYRTPLIPLNYSRPDAPDLRIFLKLETLQPRVGSFKVRGASHAILSRRHELDSMDRRVVVTASAGNMGQGVANACLEMDCHCIVVVPDHAPQTKLDAMIHGYGAEIIKVSFADWWKILESGDCSTVPEIGDTPHVFVHPVCDPAVVAGNSTCGAEICEDMPDADAILIPYGGGGLSCGIGSAVMNHYEAIAAATGTTATATKKCSVITCEPETAAPMALSHSRGSRSSFEPYYEPSFCDGCGGKTVLQPMWDLARQVLDNSLAVPLEAIEAGVWTLAEQNNVVAEGAGGITVGAAMFCPLDTLGKNARSWKKLVCVVGGGGIDRTKLSHILQKYKNVKAITEVQERLNWVVRGSEHYEKPSSPPPPPPPMIGTTGSQTTTQKKKTQQQQQQPLSVLSKAEILERLPMHACIDSAEEALVSLSEKRGCMPLRQVTVLPIDEIKKTGFLASMPSYLNGYAACKVITVYPQNSASGYSSHQGIVALFHAQHHGELVLLADAHTVTALRTAAASAVATKALARADSRTLAILGTGEQARMHFVAMMETGLPFDKVVLWGRNPERAAVLKQELEHTAQTHAWKNRSFSDNGCCFRVSSTVQECVASADVVCTVVPSSSPVLCGEWVQPGTHINAVGACRPNQQELDGTCVAKSMLFCDTKEACFVEAGDIVIPINEGIITKDHVRGEIGAVVSGNLKGREEESQITVFKSLGIALEDLTATKALL